MVAVVLMAPMAPVVQVVRVDIPMEQRVKDEMIEEEIIEEEIEEEIVIEVEIIEEGMIEEGMIEQEKEWALLDQTEGMQIGMEMEDHKKHLGQLEPVDLGGVYWQPASHY